MATKRIYGKYEPISTETRATLDKLYGDKEPQARAIAYQVSEIGEPIDQTVLFRGAAAINAAYMLRNTQQVPGTDLLSPKIRDFNDSAVEQELLAGLLDGSIKCEVVLTDIENAPGFNKRKNFELSTNELYRVTTGKYAGLTFTKGMVTAKDGTQTKHLLLDIANTPFDKLTSSWQESNFDPFEFAYKLVQTHPGLSIDEYAAAVHVYWLNSNTWAIEYNDPMAVPYCDLVRAEQVKDQDNVVVANTFNMELTGRTVTEDVCKSICEIAIEEVGKKIEQENANTQDDPQA